MGHPYIMSTDVMMPHAVLQWSFGVVMWEVFSGGKAPYPGTDPNATTSIHVCWWGGG